MPCVVVPVRRSLGCLGHRLASPCPYLHALPPLFRTAVSCSKGFVRARTSLRPSGTVGDRSDFRPSASDVPPRTSVRVCRPVINLRLTRRLSIHCELCGPCTSNAVDWGTLAGSSLACWSRPVHNKEVAMDTQRLADRLADERDVVEHLFDQPLPPMRAITIIRYRDIKIGRYTKTVRERVIASGPRPTNTKETR